MSVLHLEAVIEATTTETEDMTVPMVRGDTRPSLEFTVRNDNGVVINVTGSTPRFRIRRKGATAVLVTRVCVIVSGTGGIVRFDWVAADWNPGALDAAGHYEGELEVTFSDTTIGSVFKIIQLYCRDQVG